MAITRNGLIDFGFEPAESPYHFAVAPSPGDTGQFRLEERFAFPPDQTAKRRREVKAVLDSYRWSRIEAPARAEFNHRLAGLGVKRATWHAGDTLLAPHFGKELVLLAWAVEDSDPTVIPNMIANWRGLAPEERWWLYTTVNATSGHPEHGRDRGWRKAIKIALAENPALDATPGAVWVDVKEVQKPQTEVRKATRIRSSRATSRKALSAAAVQLTLVDGAAQ